MSGITGIYSLQGEPIREGSLAPMMRRLHHRGPDRQDVWVGTAIALGHLLLRTTPEAHYERQPIVSQDGSLVITADVRIDNRADLVRALDLREANVDRVSDDQLLLAGYERWGTKLPDRLVGDFAFAVWDGRQRQLFCARDPLGVRPFYYHHANDRFLFASEVQAMLAVASVPDIPDERQVLAYLAGVDTELEATFYGTVKRLLPGHAMVVQPDGRLRSWQYWKPGDTVRELRLGNDRAYEDRFRELFETAVDSCLRSSTPVGVRLSGGLDSSAVACVAAGLSSSTQREPIHTFTAVFPTLAEREGLRIDERTYVDDVLAIGGFEPHYVVADQLTPLDGLEELVEMRGEPFKLRGQYYILPMLEEARQQGIRVLLDGSEGDAVIGYGLDYFTELAKAGDWHTFGDTARAYSNNLRKEGWHFPPASALWNHGLDAFAVHLRAGRLIRLLKEVENAVTALGVRRRTLLARTLRRSSPVQLKDLWRAVTPDNKIAVVEPSQLQRFGLDDLADDAEPDEGASRYAHTLPLGWPILEALESIDPTFSSFQVEARHPFYDRRLVEFCMSLPAEQRLKGGWNRSIMRRALRDVYPESVRTRAGKALLGQNIVHRILHDERQSLQRFINEPQLSRYVADGAVERLWQHFVQKPTGGNVLPLLRMAVVGAWLQMREAEAKSVTHAL